MRLYNQFMNPDKSVYFNLKQIYGINKNVIFFICNYIGINYNKKFSTLTQKHIKTLIFLLETNYKLGKLLKKDIIDNKLFKISLNSYTSFRFKNKYPVRGQRTRTNARTAAKKN